MYKHVFSEVDDFALREHGRFLGLYSEYTVQLLYAET